MRKRTVLVLRHYLDWDEVMIGRELGIPIGTVKTQANKALRQLRRFVQLEHSKLRQTLHALAREVDDSAPRVEAAIRDPAY